MTNGRRYRCKTCGNETHFERRHYLNRSQTLRSGKPRSYSFLVCECESRQVHCIPGAPSAVRVRDYREPG